MKLMKLRFFALFCTVLLLFTGCGPKTEDDFEDYTIVELPKVEGVTAQTEHPQYSGKTKEIYVTVKNNSAEEFTYGAFFLLDKKVDGEWKRIKTEGYDSILPMTVPPHETKSVKVNLKGYAKLPLLPGHYRVWVGSFGSKFEDHLLVPAEFDVK